MSADAPGHERIALIVGVNTCKDPALGNLRNAVNDADEVAKALQGKARFRLVGGGPFGTVAEPTFDQLLDAITCFKREIEIAKRGCPDGVLPVFYYSGHGLLAQPAGHVAQPAVEQHYLVPSDYDDSNGRGLRRKGVSLEGDVLTAMEDAGVCCPHRRVPQPVRTRAAQGAWLSPEGHGGLG
jgi:Caspase domain